MCEEIGEGWIGVDLWSTLLLPMIVGLAAGFIGSLLGIGGGSLITPVLVALGFDIKQVIPASLLAIVGTSIGGLDYYEREKLINYRMGIRLEATSVLGSLLGVKIAIQASASLLYAVLAGVLAYIGVSTIRKALSHNSRAPDGQTDPRGDPSAERQLIGAAASTVKGMVSALSGIGGGILGVPILNRILGLPIKEAIATSKLLVGITAAAGALKYTLEGAMSPCLALSLSIGTIIGAIGGGYTGVRISSRASSIAFAVFALFMAGLIVARKILGW